MPRINRAAQFLPFDAVKGLSNALRIVEYQHERVNKAELSEEMAMEISNTIIQLEKDTVVKMQYYFDGHYKEYVGKIKIDFVKKQVIFEAQKLALDVINKLEIVI